MKGLKMESKIKKHKRIGEGEVTGHAHVVSAVDAFVIGEGEVRELENPNITDITHQEHKTITIEGDRIVGTQREIDPDSEEARAVKD